MLTVAAPVTVQLSVAVSPADISAGLALKEFMTGDSVVVVTVSPVKSQPVINSSTNRNKGISFFIFHLLAIFNKT
jgi:hypothetical protein